MTKDGKPLEFTVWTYARMTNVRVAVVLQSQLRVVGIRMTIEQMEPATLLGSTQRGEHDAIPISFGWPDADILYFFFHSSRLPTTNRVHYVDPQVDKLLEDGQTIVDPARRLVVYKTLQRLLLQEIPLGTAGLGGLGDLHAAGRPGRVHGQVREPAAVGCLPGALADRGGPPSTAKGRGGAGALPASRSPISGSGWS